LERKDKGNIEISQLSSAKKETVCAVVVTYNRKELLLECLEALRKQTRPLDAIYIIDNASTDNTPKILLESNYIPKIPPSNLTGPWEISFSIESTRTQTNVSQTLVTIHYVRMHENTGGAGGFYEGVKRGYKKGHNWLWLMDDDTIAAETALQYLIEGKDYIALHHNFQIGFLCSNILWLNNKTHVMNIPVVRTVLKGTPFTECYTRQSPFLVIQSCSFVSVLINRQVINKIGLPIKEFFIWGDDVEYTSRITSHDFIGLFNLNSIAYHKTKENHGVNPLIDKKQNAWRYFYSRRNKLFIYKKNNKKLKCIFLILKNIISDIFKISKRKDSRFIFFKYITKGYLNGIFFNPKIDKLKN